MPVGYRATGTVSAAAGTITPGLPASFAAGDLHVLQVMTRGTTPATINTPANWIALPGGETTGGAGTEGIDSGQVRVKVFYRVAVAGDTAPSVTFGTTPSVAMGYVSGYTKGAWEEWSIHGAFGADTTGSTTSYSPAIGQTISIKGGDWIGAFTGLNNDSGTLTSRSISVTGATVGAATGRISKAATTIGNNGSIDISNTAVSAGTATAAVSYSFVQSAAATNNAGATIIYRLRTGGPSNYGTMQEASGTTGSATSATVAPALPQATTGGHGRHLMVAIAADAQTITTPAGWNLETTGAAGTLNYYHFRKPCVDGETSWTFTASGACAMSWWAREVTGLTEPTIRDVAQAASSAVAGTTQTTGTTATTGQANMLALGLFSWQVAAGTAATVTGYTNSLIEDADVQTVKASGNNVGLAIADKQMTAAATVESTATWSASVAVRIGVACTYKTGGTGPFLANAYLVSSGGSNTNTLTTPSFTPDDGEILVIQASSQAGDLSAFPAPSGGSLTYTARGSSYTASHARVAQWSAPVVTSPGAMTVSVGSPGAANNHSMVVERWRQAQLAASPATVVFPYSVTGAPSTTITTTGTDSVVSWVNADWNAVDGTTTRVYRTTSATPYETGYVFASGAYTGYYAHQDAAAAGSQTIGLTAPAGQAYTLAGIEIQYQAVPPAAETRRARLIVKSQAVHRASRW